MGVRLEDLSERAQRQIVDKLCRAQRKRADQAPQSGHRSKYGNEQTAKGALRFQSKKEARRFEELEGLERAGQIRGLRLQQEFLLQAAYTTPQGERVRAIRYLADFCYERRTEPDRYGTVYWVPVVEDVKSRPTRTKEYIMKKKLMQERLGITIQEV